MSQHIVGILLLGGLLLWAVMAFREGNVPIFLWLWFKKPQNAAKVLRWGVWVAALVFAGATWLVEANTELANFRTEATSIAIAVVVIEEISRWRAHLEYKQAIIRQMVSQSREFALDAIRIAHNERWLFDGSLHGAWLTQAEFSDARLNFVEFRRASLVEADLTGAELRWAHLDDAFLSYGNFLGADLRGSFLQGTMLMDTNLTDAKLDEANLDGAIYNDNTIWPSEFTPPDTAINMDRLSEYEQAVIWDNYINRASLGAQRSGQRTAI